MLLRQRTDPMTHAPEAACDDMLGLIYDAAMQEEGWRPFLDAFYNRISAYMAVLVFRHRPHGSLTLMVRSEVDENDFSRSYAKVAAANPIDYETMMSGRIYSLRDFVPQGDLAASPFYSEHLQPAGKSHLELMAIGPANGFRAHLVWVRDDALGPLNDAERQWLLSLVPHLERSMAIFGGWKLSDLATEICTEALDQLAYGTVALDKDGRILFCNRIADELIGKSEDITRSNGRLIFRRREHAQVIRELATDVDSVQREAVLRLRNGDHMIGVLAKPMASGRSPGGMTTARVIIYFHALTDHLQPSPALLAKLFGLAPSEAMLAILLSDGATLREAAKQLGITENSARTYSKRIFMKTGVGRQADLVRIVLRSVAMLGQS